MTRTPWRQRWLVLVCMFVALCGWPSRSTHAAPPSETAAEACLRMIDERPPSAEAVAQCEAAQVDPPDPRLQAALAVALAEHDSESDEVFGRVYDLTREAAAAAEDDPEVLRLALRASLLVGDSPQAKAMQARLQAIDAQDWQVRVIQIEAALDEQRYLDAAAHLRALRRLDAPANEIGLLEQRYQREAPALTRALAVGLYGLRIAWWSWLVGLVVVAVLGVGISLLQVARLRRWRPKALGERPPGPLRGVHRVIIQSSLLFYYVFLGLILLATLAGTLAIGAVALFIGIIWWGLLAVAIAALFAILRAAIVGRSYAPGTIARNQPELDEISRTAASMAGVAPAVDLYLTTHFELEVVDQGTLLGMMFGRGTTRALVIGVGLLEALDTDELLVLLTRLYATRRPSGGAGQLCEDVRRAIRTALLDEGASPTRWINPGWYLLWGYYCLFVLMSFGPRREQALLADRIAARAHGSQRLADALVSSVDHELRFRAKLAAIEAEILARGGPLEQIYDYEPAQRPSEQALAQSLSTAMQVRVGPLEDPAPGERVAWIEALGVPAPNDRGDDSVAVAEILRERDALLRACTNAIRIALERKLNKFIKLADELPA